MFILLLLLLTLFCVLLATLFVALLPLPPSIPKKLAILPSLPLNQFFIFATAFSAQLKTPFIQSHTDLNTPTILFLILSKKEYDVIVADYKIPEMNGLEILENIREKDNKTPFILLTGKGGEEVAMEALNLDADRYIKKTMDPEKQYQDIIDTIFDKSVSS